jgi:hypothetical protein
MVEASSDIVEAHINGHETAGRRCLALLKHKIYLAALDLAQGLYRGHKVLALGNGGSIDLRAPGGSTRATRRSGGCVYQQREVAQCSQALAAAERHRFQMRRGARHLVVARQESAR